MADAAETAASQLRRDATGRGILLAVALILLSALLLPLLAVRQPGPQAEVALVFAPGTGRDAALAAVASAEGRAVRAGAWPNVLVAVFPRRLAWSELWRRGALVALDPQAFGACLLSKETAR